MPYRLGRASTAAFAAAILLNSPSHAESAADADTTAVLPAISVVDKFEQPAQAATADTAGLLKDIPGMGLYTGGGASSLPVLRGFNDDRLKTTVDGMQTTSACANHMNPPLSYIDPANVGSVDVIAGITPVSQGGDNIGGTIAIESVPPVFATAGETRSTGKLSTFYRSQGDAAGASLSASIASENASLGYAGGVQHANSYRDGRGDKVRSTQYETRNHALTLATQNENDRLTIKLGHQDIPYQGYVNQYMDMTDNRSNSINIRYQTDLGWGNVDARAYWQDVKHKMDFFSSEKTGEMPMETHGKDIGYTLQLELPRGEDTTWRFGHEFHRFTLNDWWPAIGSTMMGPNDYENINDGRRERIGVFAELESTWNSRWSSVLGIRDDLVITDTGDVQPYNTQDPIPAMNMGGMSSMGGMDGMAMGMANPDAPAAAAFNARGHSQRDNHIDLTALARYEPARTATYEFGYARKTRSPNLYERYSWGRGTMAMTMIGWFGDANAYVGDPDLKPETANTISASADWHDAARQGWQLKVTPYYTYVQDYIDVAEIGTFNPLMAMQVTRPQLQFTNRDAEIYGIDASGQARLWSESRYGQGVLKGTLAWTRGLRTGSGDGDLYHIMPLNARLSLEQTIAAWTNAIELQLVDRKSKVDTIRDEEQTCGYALVNLRTAYQWKAARIDFGISNLFDKFYYLPLGGVDYADWKAEGGTGQFGSVPGVGRSVDVGVTLQY